MRIGKTFTLSIHVVFKLDACARQVEKSMSQIVEQALWEYLNDPVRKAELPEMPEGFAHLTARRRIRQPPPVLEPPAVEPPPLAPLDPTAFGFPPRGGEQSPFTSGKLDT